LFTICLLILAAEVSVRIISREPGENNWVGAEKKYYEYDPLLGWKKIPHTNEIRTSIRGRNEILYQINSKGIRGPEYSYDKPRDEYRILILGDSFADGYMIEFNELFSEVLKSNLNNNLKMHVHFQVINTGVSGWSTDQELLFYQSEGRKYNPDLVILMFYENDITYNNMPKDWGMYYKPLFKIKDNNLILTNVPVPKPDIFVYHSHLEPKTESIIKKTRSWLDMHSYLYKFIKERINNTYTLKKLMTTPHTKENTEDRDDLAMEYRTWEKKYNNVVRSSWEITEAMIKKLQEDAAAIGSKLIVYYVPFEGSIYQVEWEKLKKKYGFSDNDWDVNMPGLVLEDICKKNNIAFMNPTELMKMKAKEIAKDKKRLYDPLDHHWTVEGNKFTGEILADYIAFKYLGDNR
jgi:lysophospholipase L1-like esterase